MEQIKIEGRIKLLSPLSHNERTDGNYTSFRRLSIFLGGEEIRVPVLSGNAIRGILRRVLMGDMLRSIGVDVKDISDNAYWILFCGGRLKKGEQRGKPVITPSDLREAIPPLSLLGGAVLQRIMPGKLISRMGIPITKETTELTGIESDVSVYSLMEEIPYSRKDDLEEQSEETTDKAQMQYHVECMRPGVELHHGFSTKGATDLEVACFWRGLRLLGESGYLGGLSAKGHGRFSWTYEYGDEGLYAAFLEDRKKDVVEMVDALVAA